MLHGHFWNPNSNFPTGDDPKLPFFEKSSMPSTIVSVPAASGHCSLTIFLPKEQSVAIFVTSGDSGQFELINDLLRKAVRVQAGRDEEPSLAIIDSQTTKATRSSGIRGFDAGKKNQRREAALHG
jgi:hypothetical protein